MTTVAEILWGVGSKLPGVWHAGKADGGAVGYILDTEIGGSDDVWNGGTAIIRATTDGLAPQGESRIISDYDAKGNSNGEGYVEVETNFSAVVGAGDRYGIIKKRYRRELIIQKLNEFLEDEVMLEEIDDSSLDTAANTKLYTLPTGVTKINLLQVWIAERTSAPYNWQRIFKYRVEQDGGTHSLRFYDYPIYARDIRLVYWTNAAAVYDDDDVLDRRIHQDWAIWETVARVLEWRYSKFSVPPQREQNALNAALRRRAEKRRAYMPTLPQMTPRFAPFDHYQPMTRMPVPEDN